jgi:hypothetical protein
MSAQPHSLTPIPREGDAVLIDMGGSVSPRAGIDYVKKMTFYFQEIKPHFQAAQRITFLTEFGACELSLRSQEIEWILLQLKDWPIMVRL